MATWNTEIRKTENAIVIESGCRTGKYFGKFWVAAITGSDPKYGLKREFINSKEDARITTDGFYQIHRSTPYGTEEYFIQVIGGESKTIEKEEVVTSFAAPTQEEIAASIAADQAAKIAKFDADIQKYEAQAAKLTTTGHNPWTGLAARLREQKKEYLTSIGVA